MNERRLLEGTLIAATMWATGYFGTQVLVAGMSAVSSYAVLVGWWLTTYAAAKFDIDLMVFVPLFVTYLALFLVTAFCGQPWFYRDLSSLSLFSLIAIGAIQAVIVCSPILFDWVFCQCIRFSQKLVRSSQVGRVVEKWLGKSEQLDK
jgi:hypothetical protein